MTLTHIRSKSTIIASIRVTQPMRVALKLIADHGGRVEQRRGGYWTAPKYPRQGPPPPWIVSANTIHALAERKLLALSRQPPLEFETAGEMTKEGALVLATLMDRPAGEVRVRTCRVSSVCRTRSSDS